MSAQVEAQERRREANRRLLARGRELALERGLTDPYGSDSRGYEIAKSNDPEYRRLEEELRALREEES